MTRSFDSAILGSAINLSKTAAAVSRVAFCPVCLGEKRPVWMIRFWNTMSQNMMLI